MPKPLSHLTKEQFLALNEFALSDSPSSQANLSRRFEELAKSDSFIGGLGLLGNGSGNILAADNAVNDIRHYAECEAILHFPPELQHPVEQAVACISLLNRRDFARRIEMEVPTTIPPEEIQRRLSHLLVQYPALLDPRLRIGTRRFDKDPTKQANSDDWAPLAHGLAHLSFASLPKLSHGLTAKQLRIFASNPSVKKGLQVATAGVSRRGSFNSSTTPHTAFAIAVGVNELNCNPIVAGATRAPFVLSLLTLSRYAKDYTGRALVQLQNQATDGQRLFRALSDIVWDVSANAGRLSEVGLDEVRDVLRLQSPFAKASKDSGEDPELEKTFLTTRAAGPLGDSTSLEYHLAGGLDEHLFGVAEGVLTSQLRSLSSDAMRERTLKSIEALVHCGVFETAGSAAQWLSRAAVGEGRLTDFFVGPNCTHAMALGFMEALYVHGTKVVMFDGEAMARRLTGPNKMSSTTQAHACDAYDTWAQCVEVFERSKTMQEVLAKHIFPPVDPNAAAGALRARAARRAV